MSKEKQKLSKAQKKKQAKQAAQNLPLNPNTENVPQDSPQNKVYERLTPERTLKRECKTLVLQCISPIHIGSGETLKAVEYLYDSQNQTVYFLDESKWINFLFSKNLIDEFAKYVELTAENSAQNEEFTGNNVWNWLLSLHEKNIVPTEIKAYELRALSIRQAHAKTNTIVSGKRQTLNDIACHISKADGQPYIPGSSIKGMFRTAILHSFIKNFSDEEKQKYWAEIVKTKDLLLKDQQKACNEIIQQLENEIFSKLDYDTKDAQIKSVMRGLIVSDAFFSPARGNVTKIDTVILQKVDASTKANLNGQTEKTLPLFRECIPAGSQFKFTVTLDLDIMEKIGVKSVEEILQMSKEFMLEGANLLKNVFGTRYEKEFSDIENADAFIGGGTGFIATTLLYSLAPSIEDAKNFIADYFDKTFRHNHQSNDTKISPRTLKLIKSSNNKKQIFGLCKFMVKK